MANIQKSDEQAVLNAIAKIAGLKQNDEATNARIKSFCEAAGLDAQALLNDENGVMNEFIESLEGGAIAPAAPTGKAAKRGRKTRTSQDADISPLARTAQQTEKGLADLVEGANAGADALGQELGHQLYEAIAYRPFAVAFQTVEELNGGAPSGDRFQQGLEFFSRSVAGDQDTAA